MRTERDDIEYPFQRLEEMHRFRVAKGESDIRGWDVVSSDHRRIGKVHDLVVERATMRVRYLDIVVAPRVLGLPDKTHLLVPIARARLDDDDNRVYISETTEALARIPPFDHRPLTADYEATIRETFQRATERPLREAEYPDDREFWGRRRLGREEAPYVAPDDDQPPRER